MGTTAMLRPSVLSKNRSPLAALRSICGEARKGAPPRSVSDWVVRHARCPVLVVGAGAHVADIANWGFDRISGRHALDRSLT
jgi:hypothetical protein